MSTGDAVDFGDLTSARSEHMMDVLTVTVDSNHQVQDTADNAYL